MYKNKARRMTVQRAYSLSLFYARTFVIKARNNNNAPIKHNPFSSFEYCLIGISYITPIPLLRY